MADGDAKPAENDQICLDKVLHRCFSTCSFLGMLLVVSPGLMQALSPDQYVKRGLLGALVVDRGELSRRSTDHRDGAR